MKLVSDAEPRGNWCKTLVGEDVVVDDLRASASGPPIEATWLAEDAHPPAQCNCKFCGHTFTLLGHGSSASSPVDNFRATSDEEAFPGIEMERHVAELMERALLSALSGSWSDRGQSSKKCRRICPSDLPSPSTLSRLWFSNTLSFSFLKVPEELRRKNQKHQSECYKENKRTKKVISKSRLGVIWSASKILPLLIMGQNEVVH